MQIFYSSQVIVKKCKTEKCTTTHILPSSGIKIQCSNSTARINKNNIYNWMEHTKSFIISTRENSEMFIIYYILPEWFEEKGKYYDSHPISYLRKKESSKMINLIHSLLTSQNNNTKTNEDVDIDNTNI
jgi:hypothetical protein